MAKLSVGLLLEDEQFRQKLAADAKEVQGMGTQTSTANQSLAKMAQTLVNMTQKTTNYAKQTKILTNTVIDLKQNYSQLTDAEKNSDFGQGIARAIDELTQKAAQFKDVAADTRAEINALASDTATWDAMKQGIDIAKNSLQAYTSIASMCGVESEKLEHVIKKVVAIESVSNTLITVGNALQKQSALMVGIRKGQEAALAVAIKLRTAAEGKGIIATKAATLAQGAFNLVAKANPYVLLASAIIGVTTALIGFTKESAKAIDKQEELSKEAKKTAEAIEKEKKVNNQIASSMAKSIVEYNKLQSAYSKCRTEHKKLEWIENNKSAIDQLGLSIKNLTDAENVFVNNSQQMVRAFRLRAEAAAAQTKLQDLFTKKIELQLEQEKKAASYTGTKKSGDEVIEGEVDKYGLIKGVDYETNNVRAGFYYTQKGADKVNDAYRNSLSRSNNGEISKLEDDIQQVSKHLESIVKELDSIPNMSNGNVNNNPNSPKTSTPTQTDEEKAQAALTDATLKYADALKNIKQRQEDGLLTEEQVNEQVNAAKKTYAKVIEDNYLFANGEYKDTLKGLVKDIDDYAKAIRDAEAQTKAVESAQKKLDSFKAKPSSSSTPIKPYEGSVTYKNEKDVKALEREIAYIDVINKKLEDLNEEKEKLESANAQSSSVYKDISDEINKLQISLALCSFEAEGLSRKLEFKDAQENLKALRKELASGVYDSFRTATQGVFSFVDGMKNLNEQWEEMSEWERLEGVFNQIFSGIDTIISFIQAIETVIEVVEMLKIARKAAATEEVTSTAEETSAIAAKGAAVTSESAMEIAAMQATAASKIETDLAVLPSAYAASTAMQLQTATENTAAYAEIPFVGPALAAAAMGEYMALWAMASIPMYAKGGILGGNTTIGDSTLFLGNKGEMILNNRQQAHLFEMLDGGANGGSVSGQVEFKIKGDTLWGVLDNRAKKKSRI